MEKSFEQAVEYLKSELEDHAIAYDVMVGNSHGDLMTREHWLASVETKFFMDYDGMGNEVSATGEILANDFFANWIKPSQAANLRPDTAYILWYNR